MSSQQQGPYPPPPGPPYDGGQQGYEQAGYEQPGYEQQGYPGYGQPPGYGPYPPPYSYGGYGYQMQARTNTLAILALVFAFVFAPAAIVLGAVARKQIRRTGEQGWGLATSGFIVGIVFTALWVLWLVAILAFIGSAVHTGQPG